MRFCAVFIDSIIVGFLYGFVAVVMFSGMNGRRPGEGDSYFAGIIIILLMVWFCYEVAMVSTIGATVGKLALGMRIIDGNGERPSIGKVILRSIVKIAVLFFCNGLINLVIAFNEDKHGVQDMASGTEVVYTR
jgi:uncharacterized RDD family membrane protein YckC